MKVVGMKECVETLAMKRGISKSQAREQIDDVLNIIKEKCVEEGGVSFKGAFSLTKVLKKGRKGSINGVDYETPDKNTLKFKVSSAWENEMN